MKLDFFLFKKKKICETWIWTYQTFSFRVICQFLFKTCWDIWYFIIAE